MDKIKTVTEFDDGDWTRWISGATYRELKDFDHSHSLDRIRDLSENLKKIFVGKENIIDFMAVCTIAQLPLLLLGTWGTAKSMLIRKFAEGLGIYPEKLSINDEDELLAQLKAKNEDQDREKEGNEHGEEGQDHHAVDLYQTAERRHFEYLVTRFTTPEELIGGMNVDIMLHKSIYLRNTRGLLPRAEIVFLDEVFKANSSILNTLLSIMNERLLYNAGLPWSANLVMLFGASNEPPQEQDLGAFYDRFPVRIVCDSVSNEEEDIQDLIDRSFTQSCASAFDIKDETLPDRDRERLKERTVDHLACVNDYRLLNKISLVKFGLTDVNHPDSSEFMRMFITIFQELRNPHDISDRSCGHFYRLARANALYRGSPRLTPEDCQVFRYAAKDPEAAHKLPGIVDELIGK